MEFVMNQAELLDLESKIEQIVLGFEVGIIERTAEGWHYTRLADRSSDVGGYVELELASPLQAELIAQWLLTDPDGQPDIYVHGSLSAKELKEWLTPIIAKWGEIEVYLNGDEIIF
jgi:hypothetical protein